MNNSNIMMEKQWDYQETAGFVSKKSIIEGMLEENAKTDKAQSENIAANAEAIAENAKADEKQGEDIAANSEAISENAKLDEKQGEDIAANSQAIADETAAREEVDAQVWDAMNNEIAAREEVEGQIWDAISEETSARTEVEGQLWNAVNTLAEENNKVDEDQWTAINNEISARTEVEGQLWEGLNNESAAREEVEAQIWEGINAESAAREKVDNEQWDALAAETKRAEAAEEVNANDIAKINQTLDTLLNTKDVEGIIDTFKDVEDFLEGITDSETLTTLVKDAVAVETERAEAAEKELSDALADEVKRATDAESDEKRARENSVLELNNAMAANVNALNNAIFNVATSVNNEVNRAIAAEQVNANAIKSEEARAIAAEKVNANGIVANANAIKAEETRAIAAEKANADAISTLNNNVVDIVDNLNNTITAITANLQSAIAAEAERAEAAEGELDNAIKAEANRADEVEKALDERVETLEAKNFVEWEANGDRKKIVLDNYENILGKGVNGGEYNLAMVSKWDVADFGSTAIHMNLNSVDDVTVNDSEKIALQSWVDNKVSANADAIKAEETRAIAAEKANADAIAVLNGEGEGSVSKAVADGIAKVVADAPEALDTLKEVSEWISSHEGSAAEMNAAINANKEAIENEVSRAKNKEAELEGKVSDNAKSIEDESERAEAAEGALDTRVTTLEAIDHDAYITADSVLKSELEDELADATKNMVEWETNGDRKKIVLDNYENILGLGTDGGEYNLVMVSKWDVADFGSTAIHMELNTKDEISVVAGTNKEVLAYKSDVATAKAEAIAAASYDDTEVKSDIEALEGKFDDYSTTAVMEGAIATAKAEAIAAATYDDTDVKGSISDIETEMESLATKAEVEAVQNAIPSLNGYATEEWVESKNYLTEHQDLSDYALKSELPSVEGLATEESVNAVAASVEGLNVAVKALKDAIASEIKSEVVLGEELKDGQFTYAPENGDLYIINSEVSGAKGSSNGKVMFTASTVNISNVAAKDITGTYNLFEQGQTVDKDIEELTVANLTVDGSLQHNVVNAYNLAEGAVITLKDIKVEGIDPSKTNLVRISNYKNVENVTINFENVSVDYMEDFNESDKAYFGFLLYQAVSGKDTSYTGTSCVNTWKVNFKNCYLNGKKVESLNFGTVDQVAYTYNFNGGGSVTSIDDTDKSGMTVSFE